MNQISFEDLFEEEKEKVEVAEVCKVPAPLSPLQKDILELIDSEEISALELCERLIRSGKIPDERFTTNKPKAYGQVCLLLEGFVTEGKLIFIKDDEKRDRVYKLKEEV
ncbi:DUF3895 domain-containing protein [Bacillus thuringiensis]|jgi:hypothetical protein|uniref:DUF3895 domain-containing protein n=14 Tax=Bacillus cereus group TaxID=86661 RepID=A0A9X6ZUK8_BACTU|nr:MULTISPECIES: DUF3895 domain-containing protein [Bacillus]MBJ6722013.1 DUF3895 domain-containing protein [Bacillus sp. PR5]MCU7390481.1 DUF3895 domain-containing protein [Bacillus sp. ST24]MCW1939946.1 DUF3895 domain-containing protein [Bacillus anthracis]MDM5371163.1 DUF3895 domain-containing protein [Bacillus bombysepticus]MEB4842553.1 DUF3895 domain-containing protein [Paenibacillus jamilae]MED1156201.1 DUF3895 domain-containing protein [Bacillus paranthracis]NIE91273.1 DUF3895 domain-